VILADIHFMGESN